MSGAMPGSGDDLEPPWWEVKQAVMLAAERCAAALVALPLRPAVLAELQGLRAEVRALAGCLRPCAFDEAVIEAEAERRAAEILAAAGLVPPPRRGRHLHAVS